MNKNIEIKRQASGMPMASGTWRSFRQEIDELFDRFSDGFESISLQPFTSMQRLWGANATGFASLAVEVTENDKAYTIAAEIPGVSEKDIEVSVDGDMLTIKGEKRQEHEEKDKNFHLSERSYGAFRRMFSLPHGTDAGKVEARFQNGVLRVTVPKTVQKAETRKIDVKAA